MVWVIFRIFSHTSITPRHFTIFFFPLKQDHKLLSQTLLVFYVRKFSSSLLLVIRRCCACSKQERIIFPSSSFIIPSLIHSLSKILKASNWNVYLAKQDKLQNGSDFFKFTDVHAFYCTTVLESGSPFI